MIHGKSNNYTTKQKHSYQKYLDDGHLYKCKLKQRTKNTIKICVLHFCVIYLFKLCLTCYLFPFTSHIHNGSRSIGGHFSVTCYVYFMSIFFSYASMCKTLRKLKNMEEISWSSHWPQHFKIIQTWMIVMEVIKSFL